MSANPVNDFAERVRKFFYYRASICEQLDARAIELLALPVMPPDDYLPLTGFYSESVMVACAAVDGLSSIWEELTKNPGDPPKGNKERFTSFLLMLNLPNLDRVCTAFLCYFLDLQGIEKPFSDKVYDDYVKEETNTQRQPDSEPTIDTLKQLYDQLSQNNPLPPNQTVRDIEKTLGLFQYVTLIYNYYRNPFMHAYRGSGFTTSYSRGTELRVRQFENKPNPQLDIARGVFAQTIRAGADYIHNLIIGKGVTDLPDSARPIIIKTK